MMTNATESDHSSFTFSALVFGLFGWVLLQASLTRAGAGIRAQALVALLGFSLVTIAFRRCRRHSLKFGAEPTAPKRLFVDRLLTPSNAGWGTLFLLIGAVLGQLVLWGWVTPLLAFAFGLTCVPWSRVPLCRRHFLASISLIAVGAACSMLATRGSVSTMELAIGAWVLWTSSIYAFVRGR